MSIPIRVYYRYNCACGGEPWEWTPIVEAVDVSATLHDGYFIQFLTSRPYPVECIEAMEASGAPASGYFLTEPQDAFDVGASLQSGELRALLQSYSDAAPEAIDVAAVIQSGEFQVIYKAYADAEPEAFDVAAVIQSGELDAILITYSNWPAEGFDVSASLVSGILEVV